MVNAQRKGKGALQLRRIVNPHVFRSDALRYYVSSASNGIGRDILGYLGTPSLQGVICIQEPGKICIILRLLAITT